MKIGEYIVGENKLIIHPDSEARHMIIAILTPYWVDIQRQKLYLRKQAKR